MGYRLYLPLLLAALLSVPVHAEDDPVKIAVGIAHLKPQHGKIVLGKNLATLDLPDDLGYLSPADAQLLMRKMTGLREKTPPLGAIVPTNVPIGSSGSWFTLIQYVQGGHVHDSPATLDSDALIKQLRDQTKSRNTKLKEIGYTHLVVLVADWVQTPHYDAANHVLSWALEYAPYGDAPHEIDYSINVLGRDGMLVMGLPGRIEKLPVLEANAQKIAGIVHFTAPHRYEDFDTTSDSSAAYGLADIITGNTLVPPAPHVASGPSPRSWALLAGGGMLLMALRMFRRRKNR